jgi:beta-mannosidase
MEKILINDWLLSYAQHSEVIKNNINPKTADEITKFSLQTIKATVPGNFELDFIKAGLLPEDLYFGTNIYKTQELESTHLWYHTEFTTENTDKDAFLLFEGIDTAAEIFVDGMLLAKTENMLIPYEFSLKDFQSGKHELLVHIIPASIYVRDIPYDDRCLANPYNTDSLLIRKAPYMYGWDIMPRTVSGGLWRDVSVVYKPKNRIEDFFCRTSKINEDSCELTFDFTITTNEDLLTDFTVKIEGSCKESSFSKTTKLYNVNSRIKISVDNPLLWWPKNYGEANLYDVKLSLYYKDQICDTKTFKAGIRTIFVERTSLAAPDGTFRFIVNGKPIFVLGTNWVPTDVFPSRHDEYTLRGLKLTNELNCNMIRCWGGNVYPSEMFYDYCDENGIMVWQDFSMACGVYPNDERFCRLMKEETEAVVKLLRNHTSIALWSGDNECDAMCKHENIIYGNSPVHPINPNDNIITRKIIPEVLARLDYSRSYLPSSPYVDEVAFKNGGKISEEHLWGPRDYFKGDFYNKNSICHFASETGYHGCPAPATLYEFIPKNCIDNHGDGEICQDVNWLCHATCMAPDNSDIYAYRIPLMTRQVERIFDTSLGDIASYALKSQISQAEAMKFFIEHFRIQKNYRWGIIWWNIIDGWPQISDAIVDYSGRKKLAYGAIKRSQQPFAIMCDEPDENGNLSVYAINDTRNNVTVNFKITEALTNATRLVGDVTVNPDTAVKIGEIKEKNDEYYIIDWSGDAVGKNHYTAAIGDKISLEDYTEFLKKADFYNELEGF